MKVVVVNHHWLFLMKSGIMGCSLHPCKGTITHIALQYIKQSSAQCAVTQEADHQEEHEYLYSVWRLRLDNRKDFFIERIIGHQNRMTNKVVESPSLEVFEKHVDVVWR